MTKPLPNAKPPGLRWYIGYVRLRAARLLALPTVELIARMAAMGAALAVAIWMGRTALLPAPHFDVQPQKAWVQIVVQIVILIVAALISYALRPKPKVPDPGTADAPVVEEGKSVVRLYGSVWIDDPIVLARRQLTPIPIRASGGKKG